MKFLEQQVEKRVGYRDTAKDSCDNMERVEYDVPIGYIVELTCEGCVKLIQVLSLDAKKYSKFKRVFKLV